MSRSRPVLATASAGPPLDHATQLIRRICDIAVSRNYCAETARDFNRRGLRQAVRRHGTAALFDWIMEMISFHGISDGVAAGYLRQHGSINWADVERDVSNDPSCPLLPSYWTFHGCGFDKTSWTCHEPEHFDRCPLPRAPLRNGRLNQSAFSLYLFIRDIADGDLVGWIDAQIAKSGPSPARAIESLVAPLRHVYGVSDKILAMSLSTLLIGASAVRPRWLEVGCHMVVVDTLVHNLFHRTGILERLGQSHGYGAQCYKPGGCADIIRQVSASIDCRQYNADNPEYFPRLVQHAIWQFCAESGLNICNGKQIDDSELCRNWRCAAYGLCDHITLRNAKN